MIAEKDKEVYGTWNKRWKGAEERERLTFLGRQMFKAKIRVLSEVIRAIEFKTVIEIGCGLGYTMQVFHDAGYQYIGIDISPDAVNVCRRKGLRAELKNAEDVVERYDLVSSDGMVEHFLNIEPFAIQIMRISRRYCMLIQPNHTSFWGKTFAYLAGILPGERVYEYNYRISDFIDIFQRNGYTIAKNLPIFFDVFRLLLFEKSGRDV